MISVAILWAYLFLFTVEFLMEWTLGTLNINASLKGRDAVPDLFAGRIDETIYRRSVDYTLRKGRFGLAISPIGRIVVLLLIFTGILGAGDGLLAGSALPPYLQGLIFLFGGGLVFLVIGLPSSLYSRFVIEEEFGFNTMGAGLFFADLVKQLVLGAILSAAFLGGLYGLFALAGSWWWLAGWGFFVVFQIAMAVLYPLVIAPLFNKFRPLPEGPLNERLSSLAKRTNFDNRGIFVMDGSRRSRHGNAYFTGIGRSRRIVLFDTLIDSMEETEIEAVLAHEIGHRKHGDVVKGLVVGAAIALAAFGLMALALPRIEIFEAFGFQRTSLHGLLFLVAYLSGPLTFFAGPLGNLWSRRNEYRADRFAAKATGGPGAMKSALLTLGKENLSNLNPHRAYSFWYYSHPALKERLEALDGEDGSATDGAAGSTAEKA